MEEAVVNKNKVKNKNRKILIILIICMLITLILSASGFFYYKYQHQIVNIKDVKLVVKQGDTIKLPKNIPVMLRNNSIVKAEVNWNNKRLDSDNIKDFNIKGNVEGYNKQASINISIKPYISNVAEISKVIIQGDNYNSELPESVAVTSSTSWLNNAAVKWNEKIDVNKLGKQIISGALIENKNVYFINKNVNPKYNAEIISRDEAINRLTSKNEFLNRPETITAIDSVKSLPVNILRKLMEDNVKVTFVGSIRSVGNAHVSGFYSSSDFTINVECSASKEYVSNEKAVLLHEIGHSFDFNKVKGGFNLSNAYAFQNAMNAEGNKLFNKSFTYDYIFISHTLSCPEEYFAECFALYFYDDKTKTALQQKAPATYEYINKLFS